MNSIQQDNRQVERTHQVAYKETYLEIASLFSDPMTQPTARRHALLSKDATEDDEKIINEKWKI